ncbi:MAG TPA: kinase [Verrucomicrobiales bacterium]|nr:kinase [Verrucomicrobiales bacterium]
MTPECILLIGIQAAGKSTFAAERFARTHVILNLDTLRTRRREERLLLECLEQRRSFVVDNTNVSRAERARYLPLAGAAGYRRVGYAFEAAIGPALERNARRERVVPPYAVQATRNRLQWPALDEGFDELHFVRLAGNGFRIEPWEPHEI